METIKIKRRVKSTLLKIKELEQFKDKNIELEIRVREIGKNLSSLSSKSLAGALGKYADPSLIDEENRAWELAIRENNANYRC
ncbi:MAG: hypothetical protein COW71_04540 [Ignavibacteriales bacterium CG18_big_fil_WC_8_21_14_2_50_31_20]|nr:MAG: hypothetical protein COW71_04540 [Ignavibacteriales bacterium CG18_big_fil_WC_8_21_14_2_50_31_20]